MIHSSAARCSESLKTIFRSFARSSSRSRFKIPVPKWRAIAHQASEQGMTASRLSTSQSIPYAQSSMNCWSTSYLPLATPPVRATIFIDATRFFLGYKGHHALVRVPSSVEWRSKDLSCDDIGVEKVKSFLERCRLWNRTSKTSPKLQLRPYLRYPPSSWSFSKPKPAGAQCELVPRACC